MSFNHFKENVGKLVDKAGIKEPAECFKCDGKYIAQCDDVTIIGNSISDRVTVEWGYGQHKAVLNFA